MFPGLTTGDTATDSLYDDETVRKIMERHYNLMRKFREAEFSRKLKTAVETRSKGYKNEIIKEGDMVFYQNKDKKAWLGPVAVFSVQRNSIFLFAWQCSSLFRWLLWLPSSNHSTFSTKPRSLSSA